MTQDDIDARNVDLLKQGYYITLLPDGHYQVNKTKEKMAEAVMDRKIYEADFNRRMNLPDPTYHQTSINAGWWVTLLALIGLK